MTGLLKDLMSDKASHAGAPQLDLDAIIEAGDKRVRRRRMVTGAGVAAVAAAVIAAVAVVPGMVDTSGPDPVQPPPGPDFSTNQPTYAVGSTIHFGDEAIDVSPLQPAVMAKADHGFVFISGTDGEVYFADGVGKPKHLGESAGLLVVAEGPYAAFVATGSDRPEVVIYNTADGSEMRTDAGSTAGAEESHDPSIRLEVLAMDGSQLYWHNDQGIVVTDVSADDGDPIVLKPNATSDWLFDVSQGVFARESFDDVTVTVSRDTDATEPNFSGDLAILSPEATHVVTYTQPELSPLNFQLFEVQTGRDLTPKLPAYRETALVNWLNENTYVIAATGRISGSADLLTCDTSDRSCELLARDIGPFNDVVTPFRS